MDREQRGEIRGEEQTVRGGRADCAPREEPGRMAGQSLVAVAEVHAVRVERTSDARERREAAAQPLLLEREAAESLVSARTIPQQPDSRSALSDRRDPQRLADRLEPPLELLGRLVCGRQGKSVSYRRQRELQ